MTAVSIPVNRPSGRALLIASTACQPTPAGQLQQLGYECAPTIDPYAAMLEICQRPLVYRAIVISLQSVYREELTLILTIKQRYPHLEVFLTQTDGRQAALAEAMRFGADGLLADDGLHRLNDVSARPADVLTPLNSSESAFEPLRVAGTEESSDGSDSRADSIELDQSNSNEPILTADELRALLEEPTLPSSGGNE